MFDELSNRLGNVFSNFRSRGVIKEKHIQGALREVKLALLEADVNYKVVKDFLERVGEKAVGLDRIKGVSPSHYFVKIVQGELVEILGQSDREIEFPPVPPLVLLLLGLQGSGKTTTAAKLARYFQRQGRRPYLIAADVYRPAAVEQLTLLAESAAVPIYAGAEGDTIESIVTEGLNVAKSAGAEAVVVDSAGRLHCDREMVEELQGIVENFHPQERLLVIDGMTGQEAVNVAETFHKEVGLSGVILTKMEGDARGGAALSIYGVTGCPIKFIGLGEGLDDLEIFYPERMASRILDKGDVVTLVERAQRVIDDEEIKGVEERMVGKGEFDLNDFLTSIRQLQKMGPLGRVIEMIPGIRSSGLSGMEVDTGQLARVEAMVLSMTPEERMRPEILNGSRRLRIARGSGASVQELNRFLNQYKGMKKLFKESGKGIKRRIKKKEIKLWQ